MFDAILDERLNNEWRHENGVEFCRDIYFVMQPFTKPCLFNLQIIDGNSKFRLEGNSPPLAGIERKPQERCQAFHHAFRQKRIFLDKRRDGIQRIEQKMWLDA